jgi:hypothetical protein
MGTPNRFDGLLSEMCVRMGYCGGPGLVTYYVPVQGKVTAEQFVDWVFTAEGMDPIAADSEHRRLLIAMFIKHMGGMVVDARELRSSY